MLAGPRGLVSGVFGSGGLLPGVVAIVIGQALGFFPYAVALVVRALAEVPVQMEQAAETLGARRLTVVRRVTLGLAAPRLRAAALVLVVLCLSDVATPLLLGGYMLVLATAAVGAATTSRQTAAGVALALALLVAVIGGTGRYGGFLAERGRPSRPCTVRFRRACARPSARSLGSRASHFPRCGRSS